MGRPTKYKKEFCQDLIDHMKQGLCIESFPAVLHEKYGLLVSRDTLYNWAASNEEFLDSRKVGDAYSLRVWKKLLLKALATNKQVASGAWVFVMKNRFGYRDNPSDENQDDRPTLSDIMKSVEKNYEKENKVSVSNGVKTKRKRVKSVSRKSENSRRSRKKKA